MWLSYSPVLYIVNAKVLRVPAQVRRSSSRSLIGHHQWWPLSPWTLDLSIVVSNPMCESVKKVCFFSFWKMITFELLNQTIKDE